MNIEDDQCSLAKLAYDTIKQNDLKLFFEVLISAPESRTICDLDSLVKIMMHIEPIKKMKNLSTVYFLCKHMILRKYTSKEILYESKQQAESLYVVLNGKIAFYKKSCEYFESDEVVFLNSGACFGELYNWKTSFLPISVQQTLLAILPQKQVLKVPMQLSLDKQRIFQELSSTDIFNYNHSIGMQIDEIQSNSLTINKVPCGQYLIREGETPRALFFLSRGIIKKLFSANGAEILGKRFSEGEYFPSNLKEPMTYDLVAETPCEIIIIPKKILKKLKSPILETSKTHESVPFIENELRKKNEWTDFKKIVMENLMNQIRMEKKSR